MSWCPCTSSRELGRYFSTLVKISKRTATASCRFQKYTPWQVVLGANRQIRDDFLAFGVRVVGTELHCGAFGRGVDVHHIFVVGHGQLKKLVPHTVENFEKSTATNCLCRYLFQTIVERWSDASRVKRLSGPENHGRNCHPPPPSQASPLPVSSALPTPSVVIITASDIGAHTCI